MKLSARQRILLLSLLGVAILLFFALLLFLQTDRADAPAPVNNSAAATISPTPIVTPAPTPTAAPTPEPTPYRLPLVP